jgi:hypothetical protein
MTTMPDPTEIITFRGKRLDRRTAALLTVCEEELGYQLTVVQGYNPGGVNASAGTHDGIGVVDLAPFDWRNKVKVTRKHGLDSWHRLPSEGPWPEHCHGVIHGHPQDVAPSAVRQTQSYDRHDNGLANDAHDPFPYHPERPPIFNYAAWWQAQQASGRDDILKANVKKWRSARKRLAEQISALRARRALLKKKIDAANKELNK